MASDMIAIVDIGGQVAAQGFEEPCLILCVELLHIITESALQLPIGLGVTDNSMNQPDIKVIAKRREGLALESRPIIKHDPVGITCHCCIAVMRAVIVVRWSGARKRSQKA
jgi:hypothetical protein